MTKILSRKPILEAKLFTVVEDEVVLDNGAKRTYHSVLRHPAVSVFPLDENYNIFLISQYRYLHEKRLIEAVAGMIDEGEEPLETAKRELKEEIGMEAEEWIRFGTGIAAGSIVSWEQPLFIAKKLKQGQACPEESEDIKLFKIPLTEAVEKVLNGEICTGSTSVGILMIDKLRQEGKI